jgi:hypothetical protein
MYPNFYIIAQLSHLVYFPHYFFRTFIPTNILIQYDAENIPQRHLSSEYIAQAMARPTTKQTEQRQRHPPKQPTTHNTHQMRHNYV